MKKKRPPFRMSPYYFILLGLLLLLALSALFLLARRRFLDPRILYFDDFIEYWAAGRLNLIQGNPYSPEQIKALQVQVGRSEGVPLMMWNPPWTLALIMPFGLLDYATGRMLWLLLSLAILCLVADWIWRFYGGAPEQRWIAWLMACTFGPALQVLRLGQITPFLLLGVAGFLYLIENKRWFWAGGIVALWLIKPHLLYLVIVVLLLWMLEHRNFLPLLGLAAMLGAALAIAWLANPTLFQQYLIATTQYPPVEWMTPTLGGLLRSWLGPEHFWLQFVPTALGSLWGIWYWFQHRVNWQWRERLPWLLLVSMATSAYGWNFDQVISLVALLPAGLSLLQESPSWKKGAFVGTYLVANGLILFSNFQQFWYWWVAPFFLCWEVGIGHAFPHLKDRLGLPAKQECP